MKYATILAGVGLLVAVCFAAGKDAAVQSPMTFQSVRQQGQIKVTLLKVSRIVSFAQADTGGGGGGNATVVPGIEVSYVVEDLGAGPPRPINVGEPKCFVAGKLAGTVEGIVPGGVYQAVPWSAQDSQTEVARPKVASVQRSRLERDYLRGVALQSDHVDLEIEAGIAGTQSFRFENVPLAAGGGR